MQNEPQTHEIPSEYGWIVTDSYRAAGTKGLVRKWRRLLLDGTYEYQWREQVTKDEEG